jgi:quinol monooxygenase YgiN
MIYVLWEFQVAPEHRAKFEAAYKGDGIWAQLFRRDAAYLKTILVRDGEHTGSYLTIDVWKNRESYLQFKQRFATDYAKMDKDCEALTDSERLIGIFEEIV